MASRNLKLPKDKLEKLVDSYFALESILEDVIGPEQLYHPSFVKGMKEAIAEYKKGHTKRVRIPYDLIA